MKMLDPVYGRRRAFTLVELLVVIAIIGVMVGLLLPAVQAAREAARRMSCSNNMKQIGLGIHMYHDAFNAIPPSAVALTDAALTNRPASWMVRILPFIEQTAAYEQTRFDGDFSNRSGVNTSWRAYHNLIVGTYLCPSSPVPVTRNDTPTAATIALGAPNPLVTLIPCYAGVAGEYNVGPSVWNGWNARADYNGTMIPVDSINSKPLRFSSVLDGLSNTLIVGETGNWKTVINAAGTITTFDDRVGNFNGGAWSGGGGHPDQTHLGNGYRMNVASFRAGINYTPVEPSGTRYGTPTGLFGTGPWGSGPGMHSIFRSAHPGGAQFVRADGSVQFISENLRMTILNRLANRSDKQTIEEF